jgi:hypothetical protein
MNILGNGVIISLFIWAFFCNWYLLLIYLLVLGTYFTIGYIKSKKALKLTRRKIQMATWNEIGNPSCYCEIELERESVDEFIEDFNKKNPESPINYSHCILKAIGEGIVPNNGKICCGNFIREESVDLCLVLDMNQDKFEYVVVEGCNKLSLLEIAQQIEKKKKENKSFFFDMKNNQILKFLPTWIVQCYLIIFSYLSYDLNLNIPFLGIKKNHFGFGLVVNTASYKIDNIFFPLSYLSRTVLVAAINSPKEIAVVKDGKVVPQKVVNLNLTYDHRFADGSDCFKMVKKMCETWKEIWKFN